MIPIPSYGTLEEIRHAILGEGRAADRHVVLNGWPYIVTPAGYRYDPRRGGMLIMDAPVDSEHMKILHPGMAILYGFAPDKAWLVSTTCRIDHVSDRCQICGSALNSTEMRKRACTACYAEEVGH